MPPPSGSIVSLRSTLLCYQLEYSRTEFRLLFMPHFVVLLGVSLFIWKLSKLEWDATCGGKCLTIVLIHSVEKAVNHWSSKCLDYHFSGHLLFVIIFGFWIYCRTPICDNHVVRVLMVINLLRQLSATGMIWFDSCPGICLFKCLIFIPISHFTCSFSSEIGR